MNATEWTGGKGFSAMFNTIGLSISLSEAVTFEPGYLNFRIFGPGPDRVNHVAAAFVAVRL